MTIKNMRRWIVVENEHGITIWRKMNAKMAYGSVEMLGLMKGMYKKWGIGMMNTPTAFMISEDQVKEHRVGKQRIFEFNERGEKAYIIMTDYDVIMVYDRVLKNYYGITNVLKEGFSIDGKELAFFAPKVADDGSIVEMDLGVQTSVYKYHPIGEINAWVTPDYYDAILNTFSASSNYDVPLIRAGVWYGSDPEFKSDVEFKVFPVIDTNGNFVGTFRIQENSEKPIVVLKDGIKYMVYGKKVANPIFISGDKVYQIVGMVSVDEYLEALDKGHSNKAIYLMPRKEFEELVFGKLYMRDKIIIIDESSDWLSFCL